MKASTKLRLTTFIVMNGFAALFGWALWVGGGWKEKTFLGIAAGFWYLGCLTGFIMGSWSRPRNGLYGKMD